MWPRKQSTSRSTSLCICDWITRVKHCIWCGFQSSIQCWDVIVDFHLCFLHGTWRATENPTISTQSACLWKVTFGEQERSCIFAPSLSNLYNNLVRNGFVAKLNSPGSLIPASIRNIEGVGIWYDIVEGSFSLHILYLELKLLHSKILKCDHYIRSFLNGVLFDVHVRTYMYDLHIFDSILNPHVNQELGIPGVYWNLSFVYERFL